MAYTWADLDLLKPLTYVSFFLGAFEIGVDGNSRKSTVALQVFRFLIILTFLILLVHEYSSIRYWVWDASGLHSLLALVQGFLRWMTLFINTFRSWWVNRRFNKCLKSLLSLSITICQEESKKFMKFQVFHMIFISALGASYQCFGHLIGWHNPNFHWFTPVIYVITEWHLSLANIQFFYSMRLLRMHFKVLNNRFETLSSKNRFDRIHSQNREVFHLYRWEKTPVNEIVNLRHIHLKLFFLTHEINDFFSLQLLMLLMVYVVELTYSLRSLADFFAHGKDNGYWDRRQFITLPLTAFWITHYLVHLGQIVESCHQVAKEANRSMDIAHNLINQKLSAHIENEVITFAHQLSRYKLFLSAGGLLPLRYSLIRSIAGSIITYLIIIVTFKA